ncbi:MAG: hypothetical protein U1E66_01465 [Rhodospirillales bacterium]
MSVAEPVEQDAGDLALVSGIAGRVGFEDAQRRTNGIEIGAVPGNTMARHYCRDAPREGRHRQPGETGRGRGGRHPLAARHSTQQGKAGTFFPLSVLAQRIIKGQPRTGPYVFPTSNGKPIVNFSDMLCWL